jgi:phenylacetate-CoA ligase
MYWDKDIEIMDRDRLAALQLERFKKTVKKAQKSVYYDRMFKGLGLDAELVKSLDDIRNFPFTTKDDLREHWPYGFISVPKDELIRMHASSGTTGRAIVVFHTAADVQAWTDVLARCIYMAGMRKTDVFQNMMTYGLFTGGLGFHYAAEKVGALVIPAGAGNSKRQIQLMRDFGTTAIHIIPSYALHLSKVFEELKVDPVRDTKLRIAFVGAEPHSEMMRKKIEEYYGFKAYNSYGLSEMNGPGIAFECGQKHGLHLWEDHFLIEIIDPQTAEPARDGEAGELVMTTLTREAMPLLRYRTRDITSIITKPCPCGRTHRRLNRIAGRSDDKLIVRGVNIYPQQIERVLMAQSGVGRNYLIALEGLDEMTVKVELAEAGFEGQVEQLMKLQNHLAEKLRAEILIKPQVQLLPPGSLPVSEGKSKRVIDNRKL